MMKTIQMTIDEDLLARVDAAVEQSGATRSAFIREALELALRRQTIAVLEQRHVQGYKRRPAQPGEFDVWTSQQVWEAE